MWKAKEWLVAKLPNIFLCSKKKSAFAEMQWNFPIKRGGIISHHLQHSFKKCKQWSICHLLESLCIILLNHSFNDITNFIIKRWWLSPWSMTFLVATHARLERKQRRAVKMASHSPNSWVNTNKTGQESYSKAFSILLKVKRRISPNECWYQLAQVAIKQANCHPSPSHILGNVLKNDTAHRTVHQVSYTAECSKGMSEFFCIFPGSKIGTN